MLLANAANVEQRVVNSDGESDQENDALDRVVDRSDLTERSDESERRHNCTDRQQERDPCGQQRAKGDEQDDEGQGQRAELGFVEIGLDDLVKPLLRADIAELLDAQARVGCGCGIDSRDSRVNRPRGGRILCGAADLEGHQRRVAVARDPPAATVRGLQPGDALGPRQARDDIAYSSAERRRSRLQVGALDEHRLVDLLGIGVVDDLGGLA